MAEMSLSDVLVQLRRELKEAQEKAVNEKLQLTVKDIEIELEITDRRGQSRLIFTGST